MYCFVYGTLKRGFRNHVLLTDALMIQEATTRPSYRLYDFGPYPCLVHDKNGVGVRGEIYEIDEKTLARLDRLEGNGVLYQRDTIELQDFNNPTIAYFYLGDISNLQDCGVSWPPKRK